MILSNNYEIPKNRHLPDVAIRRYEERTKFTKKTNPELEEPRTEQTVKIMIIGLCQQLLRMGLLID